MLPVPALAARRLRAGSRAFSLLDRLKGAVGLGPKAEAAASSSAPPSPFASDEPLPEASSITLDAYADQLKRARQLSSLGSLLPKGALAAVGGSDSSVASTLQRNEGVIRAMTAEEKATPPASLSAASRARIAQAAGCTVADVGEALGKYEWTRAAMGRMQTLRAEGRPMPTSFEELESSLGGGWKQSAQAAAAAATFGPAPPRAAPAATQSGGGSAPGVTRMLHGRPVQADKAATMPKGVTRNGPCPCGSGNKWKRCCGKDK
jgi:hypothetical protein